MSLVIGIPKEHRPFEFRVGLNPPGVAELCSRGHKCYVETGAGIGSGYKDTEYELAGATIAYNEDEVFRRADLLLKIQRPTETEAEWLAEGQTMMAYLLFGSVRASRINALQERKVTAIAYEHICYSDGHRPVMYPLSQIGGRMSAQIAASLLQNNHGGKGQLLGGIAGVPSAEVVIVGAGVSGTAAAEAFLGLGARVILMDRDLKRLQTVHTAFGNRITTMVAHSYNLQRVTSFADVVVGAIHTPGQRADQIITRKMVRAMKAGAVIVDLSIDHGGFAETSRPTTQDNPTFVVDEVIHYCVPNVPGVVGRTATHAFIGAAWPYIDAVTTHGVDAALDHLPELRQAVVMHRGKMLQDS